MTKTAAVKQITDWGYNKETAIEIVKENYDFVERCYNQDKDLTVKRFCRVLVGAWN